MKALRSMCGIGLLVVAVGGSALMAQTESQAAQTFKYSAANSKTPSVLPPDLLKVNYFSNANTTGAPDATVRITDPGSNSGNICAQIYVFDPQQELSECCACLLTPNGLRTLSVDTDLTKNPLTGVKLTTGTVVTVSGYTSNNTCSATNGVVIPAIRAWGTHIQNGPAFPVTETEFSDIQLTQGNGNLLSDCYAIQLVGSGAGICSCGTGD